MSFFFLNISFIQSRDLVNYIYTQIYVSKLISFHISNLWPLTNETYGAMKRFKCFFFFGLGLIIATHCGRENNHTLQEKSDMSRIEKHVWCDLQEAWACLIIQRGNIVRLEWVSPLFECTGCGYMCPK